MGVDLPFGPRGEDEVELAIVDLSVARALWVGVPTARLLARIRLERDQHDAETDDPPTSRHAGTPATEPGWDTLIAQLVGRSTPSYDRVKRAVARHGRAASDEGALRASDGAIAALVHALLSASDLDASPAEGAAEGVPIDDAVRRSCGMFDERLGRTQSDRRAAPFEACLELATLATMLPEPLDVLVAELGDALVPIPPEILYPWDPAIDHDVPHEERRACLLDRGALERALAAKTKRSRLTDSAAVLTGRHGEILLVGIVEPRSLRSVPPVPPSSWMPTDFATPEAAARIAAALERGSITPHRARSVVMRGGGAALDLVGAEMLEVASHPHASNVFAEILARAGRDRDVIRLVTYFAIAPDPRAAARALSLCRAPELPSVLRGWLESMVPEGEDESGASTRAHVTSCIDALEPYAHLASAVGALSARLSRAST